MSTIIDKPRRDPRADPDARIARAWRGLTLESWLLLGCGLLVLAGALPALDRAGEGELALAAVLAACLHRRRARRDARASRAAQDERLRVLRLLEDIADSSPDALYARDATGRCLFVNRSACEALGRPAAELVGRLPHELLGREEADEVIRSDREVMARAGVVAGDLTVARPDGPRTWSFTKSVLRDSEGRAAGVCGTWRDVTELRRGEAERRQWAMAFESTRDGVMITDTANRILAVNRAFTQITGFAREEAVGRTPLMLRSGRHEAGFYRDLWRTLRQSGHWQGEILNRRRDGEVYPQLLSVSAVRDEGGTVVNYVGVFTDVSRIRQSEARLDQLTHYDTLTNLPNRCLAQAAVERSVAQVARHGGAVAVLWIDLDDFKTVNDSLGHPVGDELLVSVANRLALRLRDRDTLARLGGDEFLVVVDDLADSADAATIARDLLVAIAAPLPLAGGREAYVTASIGISMYPADGSASAVELMRDADAAMYRAKGQGRNRFCFYTADLNAEAVAKLELEAGLCRALARGELALHYQPQVSAVDGALAGVEALLRWSRDGVLVPPGQFIPVAERSSLILDIGAWVIDRACAQVRAWLDAGLAAPRVAVNVAARQISAGDLDVVIARALARHAVPGRYLEVELTESMVIEQPEGVIALLRRVRSLGVRLSLDDFGTGYCSLGYLQRLPLDALKIDQSFVRAMGAEPDGTVIVDAVIALAHGLDLRVVAEGVETDAQRDRLVARGCDELQGYRFARPMPAEAMAAWLAPLAQAA